MIVTATKWVVHENLQFHVRVVGKVDMDWWDDDDRSGTCDGWFLDFKHLDLDFFIDRQVKENIKWSVLGEWCYELRPRHQ